MKYSYRYEFHRHGTTASKSDREPSHIWVDNGNTLDTGIFDHHQDSKYCCTVEVICNHLNYLSAVEPDANQTFTFHTHEYPDTDALFSIFLIQHFLEQREEKDVTDFLPKTISAIVDYVKSVDRGNVRLPDKPEQSMESLYCILTFIFELEKNMEKATEKALTVIQKAVNQSENADDDAFDFFTSAIINVDCADEIKSANEDYAHYLEDKSTICRALKCALPMENETIADEKIDTLIWNGVPTCQFNRLWARADGYVLTIVPSSPSTYSIGDTKRACTNAIISLNPTCNDNRKPAFSLLPIARYLETYEQERENVLFKETGFHKRDHSAPRGYRDNSDSLFLTAPFEETSDPWFINSDRTLIAAPHTGSLLSLEEITHIVVKFSDYRLESLHNRLIVPFRFDSQHYNRLCTLLQKKVESSEKTLKESSTESVKESSQRVNGKTDSIPFRCFESRNFESRYFNTMVTEFSMDQNNYSHYAVDTPDKLIEGFHALNDCNGCSINQTMQILLFPYGIGFFLLSAYRDYNAKAVPTFLAMETQTNFRRQVDAYFRTTLSSVPSLFDQELAKESITLMNPHYYTYAKLSPENASITDSSLTQYASMLCSVSGTADNDCQTLSFNYRQHMAYSRIGCALVSTTFETETPVKQLFDQEWMWMYLLVLVQRYVLLECKRELVKAKLSSKKKNRLQIKNLREMLIRFSSSAYFSTAVEDETGDGIYRGLSCDIYRIPELKDEVLNQLEQVSNYHDSKVTASLDKISVWILPFMVISTILQCSLITMEPLIGVSEKGFPFSLSENLQAFASWGIMFLLVVLLFIILKLTDRRK